MSLIDRVSSKQGGKRPAGPKRLAPAPVKKGAILDDIEAWEAEAQGDAKPGETQADMSALMDRFAPAQSDASSAVLSKATKKQRKAQADSPEAAVAEPEAKPVKKAKRARVAEPKAEPNTRKSREFSFDHERLRKFGFITPKERRSRISEEFRLVKRRLMQRMSLSAKNKENKSKSDRQHVIVVTSARPSEGKSFVAMNLALSIIFDEGLNVLLVDGDVARPSMSKILGLRNDLPGLTDLLLDDESELQDVLLREHEHPLSYLAAGAVVASATDLFGGEAMHTLVTDLAERYSDRIIIFDAPPLLASTEPVALAEHAGQVVLVVDAERTSRSAVDSALDLLESDQNVNLVLNKTTVRNRTEQFGSYYEAYNQVAP